MPTASQRYATTKALLCALCALVVYPTGYYTVGCPRLLNGTQRPTRCSVLSVLSVVYPTGYCTVECPRLLNGTQRPTRCSVLSVLSVVYPTGYCTVGCPRLLNGTQRPKHCSVLSVVIHPKPSLTRSSPQTAIDTTGNSNRAAPATHRAYHLQPHDLCVTRRSDPHAE